MEGYLSRIADALESAPAPAATKASSNGAKSRAVKSAKPPRTKQPPSFDKT
jgi:hypothetical protein